MAILKLKNPECGGAKYWFHSGNIFTTQSNWTAHDNLIINKHVFKIEQKL